LPHFNLKAFTRLIFAALGAVSGTSFLMHSIFNSTRLSYCLSSGCSVFRSPRLSITNHTPISQCQTTSVLLARGSGRTVRDKILLVGRKNSVSEYILPIMHLSKYDPTLTDSSYARQGLSAVKYGYPITIPSPKLRLALFNLGLADAIILSQEKILKPVESSSIKYKFRLQPFNIRLGLPEIKRNVGISEDSEVVDSYIKRNRALFDQRSYACP